MAKDDIKNLKLQSFARPPLAQGNYKLEAKLSLQNIEANEIYYEETLTFTVSAPRFALDLGSIYNTYPLAESTGIYHKSLPHIVFNRKTIPWECEIESGDTQNPWLCLVLLTEDELQKHNIWVESIFIPQLLTAKENVLMPKIEVEDWEKAKREVKTLEMPLDLFKKIVPEPTSELPFFAHTRQVDTSDKENTDTNLQGEFSVILGKRLPLKNQKNIVFLVSLQGHSASLDKTKNTEVDKRIRLIVLHQWTFTSKGYSFNEIAQELGKKIQPLHIEKTSNKNAFITKALEYGYTPLNHQWRNGKKSVSWYRGPFVPIDSPNPVQYTYKNADEALRFDRNTGMFDISYSAAWQLGRLLALQNPRFVSATLNWQNTHKRQKPLTIAKHFLERGIFRKEETTSTLDTELLAKMTELTESDEVLTDFLMEIWDK